MTVYLDVDRVIELHALAGEPVPLLDRSTLEGAVARCQAGAGDEDAFPRLVDKAAALLHGIASTQCFQDGNKRAAWLSTVVFLEVNGMELRDISDIEAEAFVMAVAVSAWSDRTVAKATEWLAVQARKRRPNVSDADMPPPLVIASPEDALAAFFPEGEPTPETPLGAAFMWWSALLQQDKYQVAMRRLTWSPPAWDFAQTAQDFDGWSMMQNVYPCDEAPDEIAYVRFMRGSGHAMQAVGDAPLDEVYVLTVVACDDGWWRAWGYSKDYFPPAAQVRGAD